MTLWMKDGSPLIKSPMSVFWRERGIFISSTLKTLSIVANVFSSLASSSFRRSCAAKEGPHIRHFLTKLLLKSLTFHLRPLSYLLSQTAGWRGPVFSSSARGSAPLCSGRLPRFSSASPASWRAVVSTGQSAWETQSSGALITHLRPDDFWLRYSSARRKLSDEVLRSDAGRKDTVCWF